MVTKNFILSRCIPEPNTGCWLWTASLDGEGYGRSCLTGGKRVSAHRASYEAFVGPIPAGLHIDHRCRVRSCVNPDHMEAVPQRINTLRGIGLTAAFARRDTCKHGHSLTDPTNVYLWRGARLCKTCRGLVH